MQDKTVHTIEHSNTLNCVRHVYEIDSKELLSLSS